MASVIDSVIPLISAVVMLGGMLFVTARFSPKLALVAMIICPPLLLATARRVPEGDAYHHAHVHTAYVSSALDQARATVHQVAELSAARLGDPHHRSRPLA